MTSRTERAWLPSSAFYVILAYLVVGSVALFDVAGPQTLLKLAGTVVVASIWRRTTERAGMPAPIMFFELGFLLVIVYDGLVFGDIVVSQQGEHAYSEAVRMFAIGMAVVVTARELFTLRATPRRPLAATDEPPAQSLAFPPYVRIGIPLLAVLSLVPSAQAAVAGGRIGAASQVTEASFFGAILGAAVLPISIVASSVIAYQTCIVNGRSLARAYLKASPVLLCLFLIGTRYPLLIALVAPLFIDLARRGTVKGFFAKAAAGALVVAVLLGAMTTFRGAGLNNSGLSVAQTFQRGVEQSIRSEGVLSVDAQMVNYFDNQPHRDGASAFSVAVFWIPRAAWPEKPTLLGNWFPVTIGTQDVNSVNSVSTGFIGDGYADGGLPGVVLWCTLLGIVLGWVDRWTRRTMAKPATPMLVVAASVYPALFFAARSPVTTMIAMLGVVLLCLASKRLSEGRLRRVARREAARLAARERLRASVRRSANLSR